MTERKKIIAGMLANDPRGSEALRETLDAMLSEYHEGVAILSNGAISQRSQELFDKACDMKIKFRMMEALIAELFPEKIK